MLTKKLNRLSRNVIPDYSRHPAADDAALGLAGGGGQQVGDGLEDGADGLGRDAFFV